MTTDDGFEEARKRLVARLQRGGHLASEAALEAFRRVPRHLFVPEGERSRAYRDTPLHIGEGQTISAPHMVALMVDALDLRPGQRVLEVGGGSGYHAAVAAEMVRPGGRVFSVEVKPNLAARARSNLQGAGYDDVAVVTADGSLGLPQHAPYDRAWVAAAAPDVPPPLLAQLKEAGLLLVPVGGRTSQDLLRVEADGRGGEVGRSTVCGCRFVPLLGEHGFPG